MAQLTAPGRAALATVGIAGPEADRIAACLFFGRSGRPITPPQVGQMRTCFFRHGDQPAEQVVVARVATGVFHVHCHGGTAAVKRLIRAVVDHGAEEVSWCQWLARTCPTAWEAECLQAIACASTAKVAAILLDQLEGGLPSQLREIRQALEVGDRADALRRLEALSQRWEIGRHLIEPWFVLLAGPANAGKSSLFNALVGYQRVIVHEEPGTTRDVVKKPIAVDGWPVVLGDSAGFHETPTPLDRAAMARAREAFEEADLVLWVTDLCLSWVGPENPRNLLGEEVPAVNTAKILFVHNKADLLPPAERAVRLRGRPLGIVTSAVTGEGVDALLVAICRRLVPEAPPPKAALPFRREHKELVDRLMDLVEGNRLAEAVGVITCFLAEKCERHHC